MGYGTEREDEKACEPRASTTLPNVHMADMLHAILVAHDGAYDSRGRARRCAEDAVIAALYHTSSAASETLQKFYTLHSWDDGGSVCVTKRNSEIELHTIDTDRLPPGFSARVLRGEDAKAGAHSPQDHELKWSLALFYRNELRDAVTSWWQVKEAHDAVNAADATSIVVLNETSTIVGALSFCVCETAFRETLFYVTRIACSTACEDRLVEYPSEDVSHSLVTMLLSVSPTDRVHLLVEAAGYRYVDVCGSLQTVVDPAGMKSRSFWTKICDRWPPPRHSCS